MKENEELIKSVLKIPHKILSNMELSFNEKLILSLDYTLSFKRGYNKYTNLYIGELFGINQNIVGKCRRQLVEKRYLVKDADDKRFYRLTDKLDNVEITLKDKREVLLPFEVYNHPHLQTGAKLLWGEYNSMSKGDKEYFSKRDTTANRLNASKESITIWTKQLNEYGFLDKYEHNSGYYTKQKIVKTRDLTKRVGDTNEDV